MGGGDAGGSRLGRQARAKNELRAGAHAARADVDVVPTGAGCARVACELWAAVLIAALKEIEARALMRRPMLTTGACEAGWVRASLGVGVKTEACMEENNLTNVDPRRGTLVVSGTVCVRPGSGRGLASTKPSGGGC